MVCRAYFYILFSINKIWRLVENVIGVRTSRWVVSCSHTGAGEWEGGLKAKSKERDLGFFDGTKGEDPKGGAN